MIKNNKNPFINTIKALYIHIPFCSSICTYCDFYKMKAKKNLIQKYVSYLIKELESKKEYLKDVQTVYIGGGTPSSLENQLLSSLLEKINYYLSSNSLKEFSIEANPIDVTNEFIDTIKRYKVTRISLGIQSFNDEKLKIMGRNHDKEIALRALKLLNDANFDNVNVDLIFGFPNDTFNTVKKDIDLLKKYNVKHISCYSLILENKTILYKKYENNEFMPLDDDTETNIYYKIQDYLQKLGYKQYEISNFSFPGYESLHNLVYWNNEHYIALGSFASNYIDNTRYKNPQTLEKYFSSIDSGNYDYSEVVKLSLDDILEEEVMLGLRKVSGINTVEFQKKFNLSIFDKYPNINILLKEHMLEFKNDYLYIPKNKLYISNTIIVNAIG